MPAYNMEAYIGESIRSIFAQTYRDWELIVINDGSADNTAGIVRQFADSRIRLIEQDNRGVSAARNAGLDAARGEFISFLDADDLWDRPFLQSLLAAIDGHTFAYCGYRKLHENGRISRYKHKYCSGKILREKIDGITWIHFGAMLIKRELLTGIRFTEDCRMGEDLEFIYKVLYLADAVPVTRELATYRFRPGSASTKQSDPAGCLLMVERVRAFLRDPSYDSPLARKAARSQFRTMWGYIKRGQVATALDIEQRYAVLENFRPQFVKEKLQRLIALWRLNAASPVPNKRSPQH